MNIFTETPQWVETTSQILAFILIGVAIVTIIVLEIMYLTKGYKKEKEDRKQKQELRDLQIKYYKKQLEKEESK